MSSLRLLATTSGLFLIILLSQTSSAKKIEILDQDGDVVEIETIAQAVCDIEKGTEKQISQFSTIQRLVQFYQTIGHDHKLADCAQQYLPAFEQMQLILKSGNEDVCSDTKISQIEKFHRNFISKARKYRKEQKANHLAAPKLLKLFYMNYVSAVSSTCERAATQELKSASFDEKLKNNEADKFVNQFIDLFGKVDFNQKYKDMYLVWNFIDSISLGKDSKLTQYLHEGKTRLFLQVQNVETLNTIHDNCNHKLRPFYSSSLLSVIRLADLGFYPESEDLVELLSSNPDYVNLYALVQLCETFLPIEATANEKLESDQIMILSKDKTSELPESNKIDPQDAGDCKNPLNRIENLDAILYSGQYQGFIKKVKNNVNSRVKEQNKILKRLLRKFRKESAHKSGKFSFSDTSSDDLDSLLRQSLPRFDDSAPLIPEDKEDDDEEIGSLVRNERGVMKTFRNTLAAIINAFLTIIYIVVWLALQVVKLLIVVPLSIFASLVEKTTKIELPLIYKFNGICFRYRLPKFPQMVYEKIHT